MQPFAIIGDSTCDLTPKMRQEHDIDYCRMMVSWTDKEKVVHEIPASLDWEILTPKQYFDLMRAKYRLITSQVTEQEFDDVFRRHLARGEDLLYIACSGALSSSVRFARKLTEEKYKKEFPDRRIEIIDSKISCMGQGMLLMDAAKMRAAGKSLDEVIAYVEENKFCYNQVATVETLEYLARAGRITASKSFFGNIFGVKPLFISDTAGNNLAVEKVKGRRNALLRVASMTAERVIHPEEQTCHIIQADCREADIELLRAKLLAIGFKDVLVSPIGPIIGATTGPGTIGTYCFGKKETRCGSRDDS